MQRSVAYIKLGASATRADTRPAHQGPTSIGNHVLHRLIQAGSLSGDSSELAPSYPPVSELLNEVLGGPAQSMDSETRNFMESRFGYDFSQVKLHTDTRAAESAAAVDAKAYTVGDQIVFGAGEFSPGTVEGRRLIAHELTHVLQQGSGPVAGTPTADGSVLISDPEDAFEKAADAQAEQVIGSATGEATQSAGEATTVVSAQRDLLDDVGGLVSDAGSAIASGVEGVASGVSDVASDAWSGVKSVAGDVADVGKDIYGGMKAAAGGVQKGVGWVDKGVDWLEDEAKSGTGWLADKAKGIPVLEQVASGAESVVDTGVDITGGALKGVTGLAGGLVGAAVDPVDTAKALYTMSEHIPGSPVAMTQKLLGGAYDLAIGDKSLGDVADETLNPMNDFKYWGNVAKGIWSPMQQSINAGKPGEAVGQAGVLIASMLTGEGEAGAAGEVAELGPGADAAEAATAAEAAEGADAAKVVDPAAGPGEPIQIPVNPDVDPLAPTQPPPAPTQLPPDFLENPQIPPPPKVPTNIPGGIPDLPPSPTSPLEGSPSALESGIEDVWPEEYNVPMQSELTELATTDKQLQHLSELADSGDVRGVATDPELFQAYEGAQGTRIAPVEKYRNLKARMKTQIEGAGGTPPTGGWHHWRYQKEFPGEATDPENLFPTEAGPTPGTDIENYTNPRTGDPYTPHTQLHQVTDTPGLPRYREMADWAKPTEVRDMFNFWNAETPLGDVNDLLKAWKER